MAGADKRQHSVILEIVAIVTVYPELVGGADTFRLIGLALKTTFCTFAKLTLAVLTLCLPLYTFVYLCIPALLLFLDVLAKHLPLSVQ